MQLKKKNSLYKSESEKKKDRKKRGNRKYGQAKFKHSRKGILSCIIAVLVTLLLAALLLTAFLLKGEAIALIGSFGLFTLFLSVVGLAAAIRGFRERDKNYLTCKIGAGVNGVVLMAFVAMFIRGLI